MKLPLRVKRQYGYRDSPNWLGDMRYELIEGNVYLMPTAPNLIHQDVTSEEFKGLMIHAI